MKNTDTRSDTFWNCPWESREESSALMQLDGLEAVGSVNFGAAARDDMASWLHFDDPNQQVYGTGDLPDRSSLQVFRDSRIQQSFSSPAMDVDQPATRCSAADAALALAARRAAGVVPQTDGVSAFNKSRTVSSRPPPPLQKQVSFPPASNSAQRPLVANFPQFLVSTPATRVTDARKHQDATNSLESDRSTVDCRSSRPSEDNTPSETDITGRDSDMNYSYDPKHSGRTLNDSTFTSSTGGSRSDKTDQRYCKRVDVEDTAGCQVRDRKPPKGSKRTRAAEVHNLSERKRRDRINERMKALQELIPNSNKTDKASMLDEAIEYLKLLQHQLQVMSMRSAGMMFQMVPPSPYGMHLVHDVAGHHFPHQAELPFNPGAPSTSTQFSQGDLYNAHIMNQHQNQLQLQFQQQQHQHQKNQQQQQLESENSQQQISYEPHHIPKTSHRGT